MISGQVGSSGSSPTLGGEAGSAPKGPLLSSGSGSPRTPVINSETVIKTAGQLPVSIPNSSDSASSQLMQRLFPPTRDMSLNAPEFDPSGLELGHFRIEARIGMGGMGAVFRAVDTRLQRFVALKLLAPSQSYDASAVKRFENEARAAARLDHENIARVYFIGEERGLNFIAFEYVTGSNVRDLIQRHGRLSPSETVNYALQIAYALKHTSGMGVVHRDIKPSNIIITTNGRAKLVDLGLARKESTESGADLTISGTTLGTFDYISPEQAKDPRSVDVRSDIYSLGCTMYHMLTGQPPYPEGTALQKLLDHQGKDSPNPSALNPQVSEDLSAIIRRMMNSDRNKRYQTADQLIRDLSYVAGTLGLRGVHPEGLVWVTSRAVQPRGWASQVGWVATVLLLVLVVGLLQWNPSLSRKLAGTQPGSLRETELKETNSSPDNRSQPPPQDDIQTAAADTVKSSAEPGARTNTTASDRHVPANSTAARSELDLAEPSLENALLSANAGGPRNSSGTTAAPSTPQPEPLQATEQTTSVAARTSSAEKPTSPAASGSKSVPVTTPLEGVFEQSMPVAVYQQNGALSREYRTLEAACSAAEDFSVIELRFNGRRTEKPCRITKKGVTIRAARGFSPVVAFSPGGLETSAGKSRMIGVQSGPLSVVNVFFEMTVPTDGTAQEYALFGLAAPGHLQLSGVAVTVLNERDLSAAVVSLGADAARSSMDMPRMPLMPLGEDTVSAIEVSESFVRGNCTFANIDCNGPTQLTMKDVAVALGRDVVSVSALSGTTSEGAHCNLRLDHVTAVARGHFLRFNGVGQGENRITLHCSAKNCIFLEATGAALVHMEPGITPEDARRTLSWSGERNFYGAAVVLWSIGSSGESFDFDEWIDHWGPGNVVGSNNSPVFWAADWPVEISRLEPNHLELAHRTGTDNPAVMGATDGEDVGCNIVRLPQTSPAAADDADDSPAL